MVSSGILRLSLAKQSCLTYFQPIRIRAANAFAALAFLGWPVRRRALHMVVRHVAARIDNNEISFEVTADGNNVNVNHLRSYSMLLNQ